MTDKRWTHNPFNGQTFTDPDPGLREFGPAPAEPQPAPDALDKERTRMENNTQKKEIQVCPYCDKTFSTIANPETDDLVAALEEISQLNSRYSNGSVNTSAIGQMRRIAKTALAAYRARFPKATP